MKLRGLHPAVRSAAAWALDVAGYYKVPVTVTSTRRTWQEQEALYRRYVAGRSQWPANPPGYSAHEYGLAWDSVVPARYQEWWNAVRRYAGFYVPANDIIHAAVPHWRDYVELPSVLRD